jgi:hypothetical protein
MNVLNLNGMEGYQDDLNNFISKLFREQEDDQLNFKFTVDTATQTDEQNQP